MMQHSSASESKLTLYRYQDGKYVDSGCYTATFAPPQDGKIRDPAIAPCKSGNSDLPDAPTPAKL